MNTAILSQLLLLENPSIIKLYAEIMNIANYFVLPCFTIALIFEYFSDNNFGEVVKKLLLIVMFMTFFYQFHTQGSKIALKASSELLHKVSPSNLFIKNLSDIKIKTKEKTNSLNLIDKFIVPNLNDLVATLFYVLGKVFLWLLKLIYSTVYHLTYVFSGVSAILYFFNWTKGSLKGSMQASLWCMLLPFVVVSILCLVGNSFQDRASDGEFLVSSIDSIVWLFGITLLLLISPLIAYGIIQGDGPAATGAKVGALLATGATKGVFLATALQNTLKNISNPVSSARTLSSAIPKGLGNILRKPNNTMSSKNSGTQKSNNVNQNNAQSNAKLNDGFNNQSTNSNQASNLVKNNQQQSPVTSTSVNKPMHPSTAHPTNQIKHSKNEGVNNVKATNKAPSSPANQFGSKRSNRPDAYNHSIRANNTNSAARPANTFQKENRPQTARPTGFKPR